MVLYGFIINGECDFTNCGDCKQQKQCIVETRKTQTPRNFQTGWGWKSGWRTYEPWRTFQHSNSAIPVESCCPPAWHLTQGKVLSKLVNGAFSRCDLQPRGKQLNHSPVSTRIFPKVQPLLCCKTRDIRVSSEPDLPGPDRPRSTCVPFSCLSRVTITRRVAWMREPLSNLLVVVLHGCHRN